MGQFTHFDERGNAHMVDVGGKAVSTRFARASAVVRMLPSTRAAIQDHSLSKGDVLGTARLAGIMATKRTGELIPLCHPLPVDSAAIEFSMLEEDRIRIVSCVTVDAKTGVEMEALTAVSVAALTLYDMCKSVDREMVIQEIRLEEKMGGKSGHFRRQES